MAATLVAFFAVGFFAASLLSLFRFLTIVFSAGSAVAIIALLQGMSLLHSAGLVIGDLAVAQVAYGLGLVWAASSHPPRASD